MKRVALIVGVDNYDAKRGVRSLAHAEDDAQAVHDLLADAGAFEPESMKLLRSPKLEEVQEALEELSKDLVPGDFFLFYFAGHGVTVGSDLQLLCRDSRYRKGVPPSPSLSLAWVTDGPNSCHHAIVLDACRTRVEAGGLRATEGPEAVTMRDLELQSMNAVVHRQKEGTGTSVSILCSCDKGMSAGESPELGHGLFTKALLAVLEKKKKFIQGVPFSEVLVEEIAEQMAALTKYNGNGQEQRPWFCRNNYRETPLLLPAAAGVDIEACEAWLEKQAATHGITRKTLQECEREIRGEGSPEAQAAVLDVCRLAQDGGPLGPEQAAVLLTALGGATSARLREENELLKQRLEAVQDAGTPESAKEKGRLLSADEHRLLESLADWKLMSSEVQSDREAMARAAGVNTAEEAVRSLDGLLVELAGRYGQAGRLGGVEVVGANTVFRLAEQGQLTEVEAAVLRLLKFVQQATRKGW